MNTALAPTTEDAPRKLALMQAIGLDKLAPAQRELAVNIATRYGLDLLLKHLVIIEGRAYITRDGLLHVAHRSGVLDGIEVADVVLDGEYWRATCSVYRKDMTRPFTYSGRYPVKGTNAKYAPEMAVKVSEVAALRRAFDVSAPTLEERWDQDAPAAEPPKKTSLAEKVAARVAVVVPNEPEEDIGEPDPEAEAELAKLEF